MPPPAVSRRLRQSSGCEDRYLLRSLVILAAFAFGLSATAQSAQTLNSIRTNQIAALGSGPQARAIQQRIVDVVARELQAVAALK